MGVYFDPTRSRGCVSRNAFLALASAVISAGIEAAWSRKSASRPKREMSVMPYANYALAPSRTHYLDAAPMISALRFQPADFEYARGWLLHVPSRHRFLIDKSGKVAIDAVCGCAFSSISAEQGERLFQAFDVWRELYWRPLQIDREFASHFRAPGAWVRLFRDVRTAWRRFVRREAPISLPAATMLAAQAE